MQVVIDALVGRDRNYSPKLYYAQTRDGWRIALHRHSPGTDRHPVPVLLCHGMCSNRWDMDGPGEISMARYLRAAGYDVWNLELRGAGCSTKPSLWNGKRFDWTFEDYVTHDAPAAIQKVLRETGASHLHWVGHSMGGMIAYALLMSPRHTKIASAVTIGSPTMSEVGHPVLDFGLPYRSLLRFLPRRLPIGTFGRLGAPLSPLLSRLLRKSIGALGWHPGNADDALLRKLMLTAVDDIPSSLLDEFAEWYDARTMTDRYGGFVFTEHLERITRPILIIAGSHDGLTPSRDLQNVFERIASPDKDFRVVGKRFGFSHDYSHADLVLGLHAPTDVYPMVREWLDAHSGVARRAKAPRKTARRSSRRRSVTHRTAVH